MLFICRINNYCQTDTHRIEAADRSDYVQYGQGRNRISFYNPHSLFLSYSAFIVVVATNTKCGEEERSLQQYWYTSWPDQKTPDKAPPLLELVQEVERAREEAPPSSGPIIVHCSAGIGRTGCFIATSILCKQLRTEGVVDILRTTCQLRLD
ncbi:tyrosine-protein phosphatase non-receptor type 5-like, partial [Seriola lalandi dorsalis]|uniref:tyrosine-protein phosphatase non-receptor type 5-like n=1 Tax=Seriola lalandi dorsalis TaxID=1841481 RepID=UPI000C6FB024